MIHQDYLIGKRLEKNNQKISAIKLYNENGKKYIMLMFQNTI